MRRFALAVTALLCACPAQNLPTAQSAPPVKQVCVFKAVVPAQSLASTLGYPGQVMNLEYSYQSGQACAEALRPRVDSVSVELVDPDNRPVPAVAGLPRYTTSRSGGDQWDVTLTVVPTRLGVYQVALTFEPSGGFVQGEFVVVEDRRSEQASESLSTGDSPCQWLERLPSGGVLCQQPSGGAKFFREGVEVAQWPLSTARTAGSTLWVNLQSSAIARYVEGPAGLEVTSLAIDASGVFAPTVDTTVIWLGDSVRRVDHVGGQLLPGPLVTVPGLYVNAIAYSPETDTVVAATITRFSRFARDDAPAAQWKPGGGANQASDGIWVEQTDSSMLFLPADARQPARVLSFPRGWRPLSARATQQLSPGDRPLIFPVRRLPTSSDPYPLLDRSEALVPIVVEGVERLVHFKAPEGFSFADSHGGFLRASLGGEHRFFPLDP